MVRSVGSHVWPSSHQFGNRNRNVINERTIVDSSCDFRSVRHPVSSESDVGRAFLLKFRIDHGNPKGGEVTPMSVIFKFLKVTGRV